MLHVIKRLYITAEVGGTLSTETKNFANFESQHSFSPNRRVTVADFNMKAFPKKPYLLRHSATSLITSAECSVSNFLVATLSMNSAFELDYLYSGIHHWIHQEYVQYNKHLQSHVISFTETLRNSSVLLFCQKSLLEGTCKMSIKLPEALWNSVTRSNVVFKEKNPLDNWIYQITGILQVQPGHIVIYKETS